MRKVLLAIVLAVATLVPVGAIITAPSANALTCVGKQDTKNTSTNGGSNDGSWLVSLQVTWNRCTTQTFTYARIRAVRVTITKTEGKCGEIDRWRVNPDTVADWNPGSKESDCPGTTSSFLFDAPPNHDALPGDTANQRCVSGYVTAVVQIFADHTKDLPTICII